MSASSNDLSMSSPVLDFTTISFPTDSLTVKQIRHHRLGLEKPVPHAVGSGSFDPIHRRRNLELVLGNTLDCEREIADRAFHQRLQAELPEHLKREDWEWDEEREVLIREYIDWGLAKGERHGKQLIRDIEAQATAQADIAMGKKPSGPVPGS